MSGKYYAVRCGRVPGIYTDWESCKAQVYGFPAAVYKSFAAEEEAKAFLNPGETAPGPSDALCMEAYVDGSYDINTGNYAYGMVVLYEGEERCFSQKFTDTETADMRNVAGEIAGARAAMAYALEQGAEQLIIYHDYTGIAGWCTGAWKTNREGTRAYKAFYDEVKAKLDIRFVKVKGHSHNHYNDEADRLAKEALGLI